MPPNLRAAAAPAAVFLASLLLFSLQMAAGKALLPSAGGSAELFAASLVFHTGIYFLACLAVHLAFRRGVPRPGRAAALVLLLLAFAQMSAARADRFDLAADSPTALDVAASLGAILGAPLLALSALSPLLQRALSDAGPADRAYPLSSSGNAGALLAVLGYPLLTERLLDLDAQFALAAALFLLLAALAAVTLFGGRPLPSPGGTAGTAIDPVHAGPRDDADDGPTGPLARTRLAGHVLRAAVGTALLSAFTVRMCRDVAVVPFLWSLPMAAYLLSFVVAFADLPGRFRGAAALASMASLVVVGVSLALNRPMAAPVEIAFDAFALFSFCLALHGDLVARRPGKAGLTAFHLALAAGGALGTLAVGLLSPLLFDDHHEFPLSLIAFALVFAAGRFDGLPARFRMNLGRRLAYFLVPFALVVGVGLLSVPEEAWRTRPEKFRGFHGSFIVVRSVSERSTWRDGLYLFSGRTIHGASLDRFPDRPATYYAPSTGVGRLLDALNGRPDPLRVGVIGLGAGALAVYARPGDEYTFYELAPEVTRVAREKFPFLNNCRGRVRIVHGDGRRSLARAADSGEPPFDLLVVDAFTGNKLPVHLLTREAFALYRRMVKPGGALALNLSNVHLALEPVAAAGADAVGMRAARLHTGENPADGAFPCSWTVLSDDPALLASLGDGFTLFTPAVPARMNWTDRFSDPMSLLRF